MTPGERFKSWIDSLAEGWKDRLRGWMESWVMNGLESFTTKLEPGVLELSRDTIAQMLADPNIPPEMKDAMVQASKTGNILEVIYLEFIMVMQSVGIILGGSAPIARQLEYAQDRLKQTYRFDPLVVVNLHRRFKDKYPWVFDELKDLGFNQERIDALLDATLFYPPPADLVRMQAREVFEPLMVSKYGLDDELGGIEKEPFYRAGMTDEQITNYWRAHWEHASWMQVVEMLHRGELTEAEVYDWFRLVEIPPFWRDKLIKTAYTWPTRVDVRRWWDMRTIDEAELRRLYSGMGYRGVNLDNYVLWTKVYTDFPSLMARWTKGWITEDDVRRELTALGMPAERVETMIQEKVKPEEPERVEDGKSLTKTEIYKGVKKGVITWEQGIELIMDLGYNRAEAEYLMDINVAVLEGSPETFEEFKGITQKYRKATGREVVTMPEELKQAADKVLEITKELEALELAVKEEELLLIPGEILPEEATAKLKKLRIARNRAISRVTKARSDYESQVAQWKHGSS